MKTSALIGLAALLSAGTAMAAPSSPLLIHNAAQRFITGAPSGSKTLYDQNRDDAGSAVISQSSDNGGGPQAADNFTVPKGHTWQISEVDVTGVYYNGSGPADSENVIFYADNKGLPGKAISSCLNMKGKDNGTGSFAIDLRACKVSLGDGGHGMATGRRYWVSIQTNISFGNGGQWGWELRSDAAKTEAAYQNPGAQVCSSWGTFEECFGKPGYLMFALRGKDKTRN